MLSRVKTAELIEIPFGCRLVSSGKNRVLYVGTYVCGATWRIRLNDPCSDASMQAVTLLRLL